MKNNQDTKILSFLIGHDGITAYAISQGTKISVPQITFRLNKLVESKVVSSFAKDDKTYYNIHPALKLKEVIAKITSLIEEISDEIDKVEYTSPDGMKVIIEMIIGSLEISEPERTDEVLIIKNFKNSLELYAKEHRLKITNIKGWTEPKIEWMALNENRCGCAPDKRHCPCPEGLDEVEKRGKCLCSVFERGL